MKKPANVFSAFVESDEKAKKAVSVPAGEWPFQTTAKDLLAAQQKTGVTPVVKAAPRKATTAEKAANKAAASKYESPVKFVVRGSGATKLFAHTAAWLELTGLIHGKAAPLDLVKELGGSAYTYHFKQGNFTAPLGGMVELTAKGLNHFGNREEGGNRIGQKFDPIDKEDYILMMREGLNDERLIKDASAIRPYKPA